MFKSPLDNVCSAKNDGLDYLLFLFHHKHNLPKKNYYSYLVWLQQWFATEGVKSDKWVDVEDFICRLKFLHFCSFTVSSKFPPSQSLPMFSRQFIVYDCNLLSLTVSQLLLLSLLFVSLTLDVLALILFCVFNTYSCWHNYIWKDRK